jgi:hypothetical protein
MIVRLEMKVVFATILCSMLFAMAARGQASDGVAGAYEAWIKPYRVWANQLRIERAADGK